jgi:hypothetical protein
MRFNSAEILWQHIQAPGQLHAKDSAEDSRCQKASITQKVKVEQRSPVQRKKLPSNEQQVAGNTDHG